MEVSANKGNLIKIRKQLNTIKKVLNILKMRRDSMVRVLMNLIDNLKNKENVYEKIQELYKIAKNCYVENGIEKSFLDSLKVENLNIKIDFKKYAGLNLFHVSEIALPNKKVFNSISTIELHEHSLSIVKDLIELVLLEENIERIAKELYFLNKKVNILEKFVIPNFEKVIKYIEEVLFEEEIEEFSKLKLLF